MVRLGDQVDQFGLGAWDRVREKVYAYLSRALPGLLR